MATPDELRAGLAAARGDFQGALSTAGANWERKPAASEGEGEGEETWAARQVAEHVVKVELFFANLICTACGYDGPASPFGDAEIQLPSAAEARTAFDKAVAAADSKINYVTETDLAHKDPKDRTVAEILTMWGGHTKDHAAQVQAASA